MYTKMKLFSLCMIAAIILLAAAGGWAAMTCTLNGSGTPDAVIAVAANFTGPLNDLIDQCQNEDCRDYNYLVCADATANLKAAIDASYSSYGYFFAADTTAKVYDGHSGAGTSYRYVWGIPVFFAKYANLDGVEHLITHNPALSGTGANIDSDTLSGYTINTADSKMIAVASTAAPYGVMAHHLINEMQGTSLPTTIPTDYVHSPLYSNITNTFNAVATDGTKSGFVSKAQIAKTPADGTVDSQYIYVGFTHTNHLLDQWAILLNSSYPAASALNTYITQTLGCPNGAGWVSFATNHCYKEP